LSGARAPAREPRGAPAPNLVVRLEGGVSGEVGARGGGEKEARQKYGCDARAPVKAFERKIGEMSAQGSSSSSRSEP
jgi:hypothetical protein